MPAPPSRKDFVLPCLKIVKLARKDEENPVKSFQMRETMLGTVKLRIEPALCLEDDGPKSCSVGCSRTKPTCSSKNYALSPSYSKLQTHSDQVDDRKAAKVTPCPCINI